MTTEINMAEEIAKLEKYNKNAGANYPLTPWGVASLKMQMAASDELLKESESSPWFVAADDVAFRNCQGGAGGPCITIGSLARAMPGGATTENVLSLVRRQRELAEKA